MDIHKHIKAIRSLIGKENPNALQEPIDTLIEYVHENVSMLLEPKNKQLRQQIADCFYLSGQQKLALLPDASNAYYWLAFSSFLNDDVQALCQNVTSLIREDSKSGKSAYTDADLLNIFFLNATLSDNAIQKYLDTVAKAIENHYPETAAAYFLKANDKNLDDEQALDYLSKAIDFDKSFTFAFLAIASIYQSKKNWKNAIVYLNKWINLTVSNSEIYSKFGLSPAEVYFDLAVCYGKLKDYENEIASYKKCLELEPLFPFAMNNLGYAYEKAKDYDNALACFQKSMQTGRDENYPYRNTFRLLKKLKRYDEAVAFGEANSKRLPKSVQNEIEQLREIKSVDIPQVDIPQQELQSPAEDEADATPEPPIKRPPSGITANAFATEARLEDEIEDRLNKGLPFFDLPLTVYDGDDGYGRQYMIPAIGRLDLLAVHTETNDFYVLELKRGLGDDEVVGQVSRYMGWIKQNLAADGQNVYGIICTAGASDRLKYAAAANPNISVFNYSVNFSLA